MENALTAIPLLLQAFNFAAEKHRHQRRRDEKGSPYINHLIEVAKILWEIGEVHDMPTIVAGILHDTIEDTGTSPEELEAAFGAQVRAIVQEVTDDKSLPKQVRKRLQIEHAGNASLEARCVKLADKISNILDLMHYPPATWPLERKIEYVDWAEAVINNIRGSNAPLEQYFDDVCRQARQLFSARETHENYKNSG